MQNLGANRLESSSAEKDTDILVDTKLKRSQQYVLAAKETSCVLVCIFRSAPAGPGSDFFPLHRYGSWGTQCPARRENEAKLFSEVHRNRTRCSRHKLDCGKSQSDVRKKQVPSEGVKGPRGTGEPPPLETKLDCTRQATSVCPGTRQPPKVPSR